MVDTQQPPQKSLAELKKMLVCTENALTDFNWKLNMPLDYSQVQKDNKIVLDHTQVKENQVIIKDIRAPLIEFTFDLCKDSTVQKAEANGSAAVSQPDRVVKMDFNKVQLQMFFEELEKIQLKVDELTN